MPHPLFFAIACILATLGFLSLCDRLMPAPRRGTQPPTSEPKP